MKQVIVDENRLRRSLDQILGKLTNPVGNDDRAIEGGDSPELIARNYRIPVAAVREAVKLASLYDYEGSYA